MSSPNLPAPGYYPAPHANGEMLYWDGQQWHAPQPSDAGAGTSDERKKSVRFISVRRRTVVWSLAAAVVVGIVMGSAVAGGTASSEVTSLKAEVVSLQTEVADAESVATEAIADAADRDELAEEGNALADERDAATARTIELEAQLASLQGEVDQRQQRITELEAAVARSAPAPAQPAPAQPASAYYKNCDAARAAGATPVRRGDPGYGSHLDRDGDGVACE